MSCEDSHDNDIRKYGSPDEDIFKPDNLLTKAHVLKSNNIPRLEGIKCRRQKKRDNNIETPPKDYSQRKDALAVAVRFAASHVNSAGGSARIHNTDNNGSTFGGHSYDYTKKAEKYIMKESELPGPGFSRRDGDGRDLFGARYISNYKELIEELVEKGNKNSSAKLQPAQMLEIVKKENEKRVFVLPDEYEIRCYVGQILSRKGKKDSGNETDEHMQLEEDIEAHDSSNAQKTVLDEECVNWVIDFISKDGNFRKTPSQLLKKLGDEFPSKRLFFENNKKEVRKKLSQLKQKVKNSAMKSIV